MTPWSGSQNDRSSSGFPIGLLMSFDMAPEDSTAVTADAGRTRMLHSPAYAADRAKTWAKTRLSRPYRPCRVAEPDVPGDGMDIVR